MYRQLFEITCGQDRTNRETVFKAPTVLVAQYMFSCRNERYMNCEILPCCLHLMQPCIYISHFFLEVAHKSTMYKHFSVTSVFAS